MCSNTDKDDVVNIEMQCDMLFILSALCDGDVHRKVRMKSELNTARTKMFPGFLRHPSQSLFQPIKCL